MPLETFLALVLFAFTTSITPGPNNMMLFASGVNFGFRRTIPHMLGIGVGFLSLLIGVGLGLGALMQSVPVIYTMLKFAGGAYLVWIAWKIGTSRSLSEGKAGAKPMTFFGAAAFQWVNPKAWRPIPIPPTTCRRCYSSGLPSRWSTCRASPHGRVSAPHCGTGFRFRCV